MYYAYVLISQKDGIHYYAYVLISQKDGIHYYGNCSNLSDRLKQHNAGKVRFTKGHIPWEMQYWEEFSTRVEAVQREKYFKTIDGRNWLKKRGII